MPGDRPTLFNPYLLSLGVLRWQRVGRLLWGGGKGWGEGKEREEVGVSQGRERGDGEGGFGGPHMTKEIKQSTKCPLVSASEWDFPLPG